MRRRNPYNIWTAKRPRFPLVTRLYIAALVLATACGIGYAAHTLLHLGGPF